MNNGMAGHFLKTNGQKVATEATKNGEFSGLAPLSEHQIEIDFLPATSPGNLAKEPGCLAKEQALCMDWFFADPVPAGDMPQVQPSPELAPSPPPMMEDDLGLSSVEHKVDVGPVWPLSPEEETLIRQYRRAMIKNAEHTKLSKRRKAANAYGRKSTKTYKAREQYSVANRPKSAATQSIEKRKLGKKTKRYGEALMFLVLCCFVGRGGVAKFNQQEWLAAQDTYRIMSDVEKWRWMRSEIDQSDNNKYTSICGEHRLCRKCWWLYHGFGRSRFYKVKAAEKPPDGPGRGHQGHRSPAYCEAIEFVTKFIDCYGDAMPDDQTIQLPVCSKKELFECYVGDCGAEHLSLPAFNTLMRTTFSHILTHTHKRFKQCDFCHKCDKNRRDQKLRPVERARWAHQKRLHRERVGAEKQKYYHHRYKARQSPEKYCSIIIDNMDSWKTTLPRWARETAAYESLFRLRTHLTGVIVHGKPNRTFCYIWPDRYPKDSNFTCSIILDVLDKIKTDAKVLYLQVPLNH